VVRVPVSAVAQVTPLVLHLKGCYSATAAAYLVTEAQPEVEVRAVDLLTPKRWTDGAWLLGLAVDPYQVKQVATAIDPTPEASVVKQVWRLLRAESECGHCAALDTGCPACDGDSWHVPAPPWWLTVLDDTHLGRLDADGEAALAWMLSWAPRELFLTIGAGSPRQWGQRRREIVETGREILRAKGRWEAAHRTERDGLRAGLKRALDEWMAAIGWECEYCGSCAHPRHNPGCEMAPLFELAENLRA
jgi:hypothetical protein